MRHIVGLLLIIISLVACSSDASKEQSTNRTKETVEKHKPKMVKRASNNVDKSIFRFKDQASGKFGYKNKDGEVIVKAIYPLASDIAGSNRIRVSNGKAFGFINEQGKEVITIKYQDANMFDENRAAVKRDGKWTYIDPEGKELMEPTFDYTLKYSEGLATVLSNGKWGVIDINGKLVIPHKYKMASIYANGLMAVQNDAGKWGYIDSNDKLVIPFEFDSANLFGKLYEDLAEVSKGSKKYFINQKNECVHRCD